MVDSGLLVFKGFPIKKIQDISFQDIPSSYPHSFIHLSMYSFFIDSVGRSFSRLVNHKAVDHHHEPVQGRCGI